MKRFLILLFIFYSRVLLGQNNEYQFSKLDISNGLSHNQVNCIFKDRKGFMWCGTLSGLSKYNGYKVKVFKHEAGDNASLSDDYIVSLSEGPDNNLWVETRNGFNIYDPVKETFRHNVAGVLKEFGVPAQNFTALKKDRSGNFWFLNSFNGIYKYNPASKKTEHISYSHGDNGSIYNNAAVDLSVDSKGNIWLVYNKGVLERLNGLTHRVSYRKQLGELPAGLNTSYKIYIDRQDDIWSYVPSY